MPSPSESTYLAKLKLLSFQGLICVTPMEGLGGGLMRHKMMINEFIGRCSSNKELQGLWSARAAWRRRSTQLGVSLGWGAKGVCEGFL